jgi:dTDP-4-amino-4,6-dideoxygalactose transaminase
MPPEPRLRFVRPSLPPVSEWAPFLEASYAERRFSNFGPAATRLEREITESWVPADREAVLVSSATAGLVAALLALDVHGPVMLPSFTFPATAHAVQLAGCTPVLCDVNEETWELDPEAVAAAVIKHECAAIMHVRALGLCRDLSQLEEVARSAGVPLIVDAAAAFGGRLDDGTLAGGAGDVEVMSFHATKVFAIGEGGVVVAPPRLAADVRRVINFSLAGRDVERRGLNGKLSEFGAAVGLGMLRRFEEQLAARARTVERLLQTVREADVGCPPSHPGRPPWQCLPLDLVTASRRDGVLAELGDRGVEARTYYADGLHRTRAFGDCATGGLHTTEALSERILCLPVYSDASEAELDILTGALRSAVAAVRSDQVQ